MTRIGSQQLSVLGLLLILAGCVLGLLTERPRNTVTQVGVEVTLRCATNRTGVPVDWLYKAISSTSYLPIFEGGTLVSSFRLKIEIIKNGVFKLVIRNVSLSDSGTYKCVDKAGFGPDFATAEVVVFDTIPQCSVNAPPGGFIGANQCGIEPDTLNATCTLRYRGNQPPILLWRNLINRELLNTSVYTTNPDGNQVTSNLVLTLGSAIHVPSYACEVQDYSSANCEMDDINVINDLTFGTAYSTCGSTTAKCSATVSPRCSYHWMVVDSKVTVSNNREVTLSNLSSPYSVQCFITCPIRSIRCTFDADVATCSDAGVSIPLAVSVAVNCALLFAVVVGLLCIYCAKERKRRNNANNRTGDFQQQTSRTDEEQHLMSNNNCSYGEGTLMQNTSVEEECELSIDGPTPENMFLKWPVELMEIVLMKTVITLFKNQCKIVAKDPSECIFQSIASVSRIFLSAITSRKWFATTVKQKLHKIYKPCGRILKHLTRINTGGDMVRGVAEFEGKLYILCLSRKFKIRVHLSSDPFTKQPDISVGELRVPYDIIASSCNKCLYVVDFRRSIWRVNSQNSISRFIEVEVHNVFMANELLIVTVDDLKVFLYNPSGDCISSISLSLVSLSGQVANRDQFSLLHVEHKIDGMMNFLVLEDNASGAVYSTVIVDKIGNEIKRQAFKFDLSKDDAFTDPCHVAMDPTTGRMFIADVEKGHVLLFDSNLGFIRILLTVQKPINPHRLCYIPNSHKLVVGLRSAHRDIGTGKGYVDVYDTRPRCR